MPVMLVLIGLSGCLGGGGEEQDEDADDLVLVEEYELEAGKGAIAGLVIDDRFRTISGALVLLQETGATTTSSENGEFQFLDLDPGQYTLRIDASGHEASPMQVAVEEGVFAEANVVARRLVTDETTIVTEEYVAFSSCQASAPAVTAFCDAVLLDQSGDSSRASFNIDYTEFGTNVTYMVVEMLVNKDASTDGAFKTVVRRTSDTDQYLINDAITEGSYLKTWTKYNETSPHDVEDRNHEWMNEEELLVQLWAQGLMKEETQVIFEATCAAGQFCTADSRGLGVQAGIEAKFVISVFLGEPETDIENYCTLC